MKNYTCHVCGYSNLDEPPYYDNRIPSFNICDCCGFQYGYNDSREENMLKYRKKWIESGGEWLNEHLKPNNWDMKMQLKNIHIYL